MPDELMCKNKNIIMKNLLQTKTY